MFLFSHRKICRNCNCKLEDHDVKNEEETHQNIVAVLLADRGITKLGKLEINVKHEDLLENHPLIKKNVQKNFIQVPKASASVVSFLLYCIENVGVAFFMKFYIVLGEADYLTIYPENLLFNCFI